jgi:hypothetical protein
MSLIFLSFTIASFSSLIKNVISDPVDPLLNNTDDPVYQTNREEMKRDNEEMRKKKKKKKN